MIRKITKEDLHHSNIPRRYWDVNLFSYNIEKLYLDKIHSFVFDIPSSIRNGVSLLFSSPNAENNLKTSISISIIKFCICYGYKSYYLYFRDLEKKEVFKIAKDYDIVCIDEISIQKEYQASLLEEILTHRYDNCKSTIIVLDMNIEFLPPKTYKILDDIYSEIYTNNFSID